jgi:hypothetical protein
MSARGGRPPPLLVILRRGSRPPGEIAQPEQNLTEASGVDPLIDVGG